MEPTTYRCGFSRITAETTSVSIIIKTKVENEPPKKKKPSEMYTRPKPLGHNCRGFGGNVSQIRVGVFASEIMNFLSVRD
jgi:hypothetical protein